MRCERYGCASAGGGWCGRCGWVVAGQEVVLRGVGGVGRVRSTGGVRGRGSSGGRMGRLAALRDSGGESGYRVKRKGAVFANLPTFRLVGFSTCREVGDLESWRGVGGAGGVIAECSDCIVLSLLPANGRGAGGFLVYPGGKARKGRRALGWGEDGKAGVG